MFFIKNDSEIQVKWDNCMTGYVLSKAWNIKNCSSYDIHQLVIC